MSEYIEREALVHHFMTTRQYLTKDLVMDAAYEVSKFPAADVAPVVHGHWKWNIERTRPHCSRCAEVPWRPNNKDLPNYCPNCGARMDGESPDA